MPSSNTGELSLEIESHLQNLSKVDGVTGVLLISQQGELAGSLMEGKDDAGLIAGLVQGSLSSGSRIADSLGKSPLKQSYVEFENSSITLDLLKDGSTIVVIASRGANLGRIRLEIRKAKKGIEGILD
jgi:predicted regulator of Ras-like GTPase activity (Roadblock/LC7/MglB family)